MQRSAGAVLPTPKVTCPSLKRRDVSSARRAAAGGPKQVQCLPQRGALPETNRGAIGLRGPEHQQGAQRPHARLCRAGGASRRTCASCRARARSTRGSGPRPPQTGESGYGAARGSLGFDPRGRPPPAPLDGAVQFGTSLWPHVQGHGARVRGQGERARDARRVPVRRAPKCPLRLWAHTRRGNHQSVPGRKAEVKEGRVPGPSYGLTWAARYAGGGRRCPCVDRYLSPKKKRYILHATLIYL